MSSVLNLLLTKIVQKKSYIIFGIISEIWRAIYNFAAIVNLLTKLILLRNILKSSDKCPDP